MKNETLKLVILQIKKYGLTKSFDSVKQFKEWFFKLDNTQIEKFLSLDINPKKVKHLRHLLINNELLKCTDYKKRVDAISKIRNVKGCLHLLDRICTPNFLKSKNFYSDIEMLSRADTIRYALWVIGEDAFIDSPYHDEDLKLIVGAHDVNLGKPLDSVVSDALATVARNIDSINSLYHQEDMRLIFTSGSHCLQPSYSYPKESLNCLAVDKVSLNDKYHLENMKILAKSPISSEFLYKIMTDLKIVNGENYRDEVEALEKAKSRLTARALYYYIARPEMIFDADSQFYFDYKFNFEDVCLLPLKSDEIKNDPDYLSNLSLINKIDDRFVMHFVALLMNQKFISSTHKDFDLNLLQTISNRRTFMALYRLMIDENSLNSKYHRSDAIIISQAALDSVRALLLEKAINEDSLKSANHEYDMKYISKLDWDAIDGKIQSQMLYYWFNENGLNDSEHAQKLEALLKETLTQKSSSLSSYFDDICKVDENSVFKKKLRSLKLVKKR